MKISASLYLRKGGDSSKFILDCALSEEALYFCGLNVKILRLLNQMIQKKQEGWLTPTKRASAAKIN